MFTEKVADAVGQEERGRDHFMPWWLWRDTKLAAGMKLPEIGAEWTNVAHADNTDALYDNGEWLLPVNVGVFRDRVRTRTQGSEQARSVQVTNVEQLRQLSSASRLGLDAWQRDYKPAHTVLGKDNIPILDLAQSDASVLEEPECGGYKAIEREVTCRLALSQRCCPVTAVTW